MKQDDKCKDEQQFAISDDLNELNASSGQSALEDLNAQNAEDIKGGPSTSDSRAIKITNHNETLMFDELKESDADIRLTDLKVSSQLERTIAGGNTNRDVVVTREDKDRRGKVDKSSPMLEVNHNETVAEENESEATIEKLDDLPVSEEQSSEVAGGAVQKVREAAAKIHC